MTATATHPLLRRLADAEFVRHTGTVTRVLPGFIEASGPNVGLGTVCEITGTDGRRLMAEAAGASSHTITLMPFAPTDGVRVGDRVAAVSRSGSVRVGDELLGRAVDGLLNPIDDGPVPLGSSLRPLQGQPVSPMQRSTRSQAVETGVRAIDSLLTLATGQRIGVFAGSGVGKTTLVNAMTRQIQADVKVICLVGERGREAADFWCHNVSDDDRARTVLVASTSDQPAVLRARAVLVALALAEHFRDQGRHVLFMMDSITRYAMALREIGLAVGEPPIARAYTPSVFAALPKVVERCGAQASGGAITALFSVLAESDDLDDPLSEAMRSLLDGHILLSRTLAEQGHYPAIEITRSVSRLMGQVATAAEVQAAHGAVAALAQYEKSRILIETGAYKAGNSPAIDRAVSLHAPLMAHLAQDLTTPNPRRDSVAALNRIVGASHASQTTPREATAGHPAIALPGL